MFQGRYTRWNPLSEFEGKRMYCDVVHDDQEGLRIWFSTEKPAETLMVRFAHVLFYAKSHEGKRLSAVENDAEMKFPHVFWKVENSALLAEFHRQSSGIHESLNITHYAFLSSTDCIDVLSVDEPVLEGNTH